MKRFSEQQTITFVKLYRYYDILWNLDHKHFKNKEMIQIACEKIARAINLDDFTWQDVRRKIKNLRHTYRLEMQKITKLADRDYESNLKWLPLMKTFFHKIGKSSRKRLPPKVDSTLEIYDRAPEDIEENPLWEHSGRDMDMVTLKLSTAPSMSSETEIEQSVMSIVGSEVIAVTPEEYTHQSVANSTVFTVIPEIETVSHSQGSTITPEIITVKADSNLEPIPITSGINCLKSISNPVTSLSPKIQSIQSVSSSSVNTVLSGMQAVSSASGPRLFAIIPEGQASKPGSKLNFKYVRGPCVIQPKTNQVSTNGTRKRLLEEVSSTNSSNDNHQINPSKLIGKDFSDGNEDEMDAFGHFVALSLRELSLHSSLSAQTEILSVLTRHRRNDSAANLPKKQIVPYILTNTSSPTKNPISLEKVFLKS